jgi:hypothetical protein
VRPDRLAAVLTCRLLPFLGSGQAQSCDGNLISSSSILAYCVGLTRPEFLNFLEWTALYGEELFPVNVGRF